MPKREERNAPAGETAGVRTVRLTLSEGDFRALEGLAAWHRQGVEDLLRDGLPRILEKYRVLRGLGERGAASRESRRGFVTGTSQFRHVAASARSQPQEEENA